MFLLVNGVNGCLKSEWMKHIPESQGYRPSQRFEELMQELVSPVLQKVASAARIDFSSKVSAERLKHLCSENLSLEPENWIFKWSSSGELIDGMANA